MGTITTGVRKQTNYKHHRVEKEACAKLVLAHKFLCSDCSMESPALKDSESLQQLVDPSSTYALRNPLKDVIPPKQNASKRKKTDSEQRAEKLSRDKKRQKSDAFRDDVQALLAAQEDGIAELARRHGYKREYVEQAVKRSSSYKPRRAPTVPNALVAAKRKELNTGKWLS